LGWLLTVRHTGRTPTIWTEWCVGAVEILPCRYAVNDQTDLPLAFRATRPSARAVNGAVSESVE
jgi:hypothetical protein